MMKKKLITALSLALMGTFTLGLAACGGDAEVHDDILNGGFETGDLTGWTKSGTAFSATGVVSEDKAGEKRIPAGMAGKYFFSGYDSANAQFTGTLQSDPFVLGGTGKIGFLMGGGMNGEKCYVEFFEQGNDTALAKVTNEAFAEGYVTDQMVRTVVDLSAHVGKTVYIRITDSDKGDADEYAYLNLDDFVVYKTDAEVSAAQKERDDRLADIGKPAFSETETDTTIKNGNFEDKLQNWLVLEGNAFYGDALYSSEELFWGTRSYNAEGKYFLCTYFDESATGAIRSTKFTLAGDGIISFLMAGAKNDGSYVAVCDGATDEELYKVTFDKYFSDPNLSENMVRHYVNAGEYLGKVLYLKVVDGERTDFAGICVDDFKVSMTEAETKAQMEQDYLAALALEEGAVAEATRSYYSEYEYPYEFDMLRFEHKIAGKAVKTGTVDLNAYLGEATAVAGKDDTEFAKEIVKVTKDGADFAASGFDAVSFTEPGLYAVEYKITLRDKSISETFLVDVTDEHSVMNGGFEAGSIAGWEVVEGSINAEAAANSDYYGFTGAPYNQAGSYHFDGAAAASEDKTYTLRSSDFVLDGAGIISFKLGGNAARLRVFDRASGVCLAEFVNIAFSDNENPHVEKGCRNLTMTTYYCNLMQYMGFTLYIEVSDTASSNWGVLHFDDVVTYYPEGSDPAVNKDTVTYTCEGGENTFDIEWLPASNMITPNLLVVTHAPEYTEIAAGEERTPESFLGEITGGVIGEQDPEIVKSIVKINDGAADVTTGFDSYRFEAGKTYTVTYRLSYTPDGGDEMSVEGTFTVHALTQYDVQNGGFETGDLTGWEPSMDLAAAVNTRYTYWGEEMPLNQTGKYLLNAEGDVVAENATWTLKSGVFTLGGSGVISFRMGGNGAELRVYTEDGIQLAAYRNTKFANPGDAFFPYVAQGCRLATMTAYVADLSQYLGLRLYLVLADTGTQDFGFACFDDIVTYYPGTAADVKAALLEKTDTVLDGHRGGEAAQQTSIAWEEAQNTVTPALLSVKEQPGYTEIKAGEQVTLESFKSKIKGAVIGVADPAITVTFTRVNDGTQDVADLSGFSFAGGKTYTVYFKLSYTPDGGAEMTAEGSFTVRALTQYDVQNGGFETGDMTGWTPQTEGFNSGTAVLGADKYWGEELPYNQSGNYHLDGWNTGIDEPKAWSVKSETFVLGGAGIITVRMGGAAAAVKVYKVADGTETLIGHYKQTAFGDHDFPDVTKGSWADMRTYVIDLHGHEGETLRIELCDEVIEGGWAHAFFDEVVTYYADGTTVDDLLKNEDTVTNGHNATVEATEVKLPWIAAKNTVA